MQKQGLPWAEVRSNLQKRSISLEDIKAWRKSEASANRPSGYKDFCLNYDFCQTCLGEGVTINDNGIGFKIIGMDGDIQLFEQCPVCEGSGRAGGPYVQKKK